MFKPCKGDTFLHEINASCFLGRVFQNVRGAAARDFWKHPLSLSSHEITINDSKHLPGSCVRAIAGGTAAATAEKMSGSRR